jgi:glutamate-ammonia-ligase adenylyltransferase
LCEAFEQVRADTLSRQRDPARLREDVSAMRGRMRAELDRSGSAGAGFDLKQGAGGLVDLEFLLQYLVLRDAHACRPLLLPRDTPRLLEALHAAGTLAEDSCAALQAAHATLLDVGLRCTLDRRPRIAPETDAIAEARAAVRAACSASGLAFS